MFCTHVLYLSFTMGFDLSLQDSTENVLQDYLSVDIFTSEEVTLLTPTKPEQYAKPNTDVTTLYAHAASNIYWIFLFKASFSFLSAFSK